MTASLNITATDPTGRRQTTMTAVGARAYGSADTVQVLTVPVPVPAPDEVCISVRAAGVDRGVWHLMTGLPYVIRVAGYGLRRPKTPVLGLDVAGVVRSVGSDVTRFSPGDEVFGICSGTGTGSFAEVACAKESKLAHKPASVSFTAAAAVPVSGLTAIQAVRDHAKVQPGQTVLVIGASGGVGTFAVQVAKALGATVTGVCSGGKADLVTSLGADHVIDHTTEDLAAGDTYDAIIDIAGNTSLKRLRRVLAPEGTLVIVGGEGGGRWIGGVDRQLRAMALSPLVSPRLCSFISSEDGSGLEGLTQLIETGKLVPAIDSTYALAEGPAALRRLESGAVRGKVVITSA